MSGPTSWARWVLLVGLNLALAATGVWLVLGMGTSAAPPDPGPAPVQPFTAAAPSSSPEPLPVVGDAVQATTGSEVNPTAARHGCRLTLGASRLMIPALCVNAPVVATTRTAEGALTIPHDVRTIGHWDGSARLADPHDVVGTGTTLLAGHVNLPGQGSGALYRLGSVQPHDLVYTADPSGVVSRWRVVSLVEVHKDRLPDDVFAGKSGARRLVIVTCGGPILQVPGHGASYRDNVIVTAVPA